MNSLQDSLLSAMEAMSKSTVENQSNTITIEAEVIDVVDSGLGLYKVRYLENYFNVYSNNIDNNYNIGDNVYIVVPSGDFTKDKFILGTADATIQTYVPSTVETIYEQVSEDLLHTGDAIRMRTYHTEIIPITIRPDSTIEKFNNEVSAYLRTYNTLGLFCNIKTDMPIEQQARGNYGLHLKLPIISTLSTGEQTEEWKEVYLDVSNIKGNPYGLLEESAQQIYIEFSDNEVYDLTSGRQPVLEAFVQDFVQSDDYEEYPYDIYINSIQLKAIDVITPENLVGYHLSLKTDTGNFFITNGPTQKVIEPVLRINGQVTTLLEDYACYWFEQDSTIKAGSDRYVSNIGGIGWKCLNQKNNSLTTEDGSGVSEWITNVFQLKVNKENYLSKKYKCVIIVRNSNNETQQLSKEIEIVDLTMNVSIRVITDNGDNIVPKKGIAKVSCIVDVQDSGINGDNFSYVWKINDNEYIPYAGSDGEPKVEHVDGSSVWVNTFSFFTDNYTSTSLDVNCVVNLRATEEQNDKMVLDDEGEPVLDEDGNIVYTKKIVNITKFFASKTLTLFLVNIDNYFVSFKNNNVVYKYDAAGNSPLAANYGGPVGSRIVDGIKPIYFEVKDKYGSIINGNSFTTTWILPPDNETMLTFNRGNYEVSSLGYTDLVYSIKEVYDHSKTNNTVILRINIGDLEIDTPVTVQFLKDGQPGTNGTSYSTIIKYKSGSEYWSLNQRDQSGRRRNAKLIYLADNTVDTSNAPDENPMQKWYRYSYRPNEENYYDLIADTENQRLEFMVELYRDGQLIVNNNGVYSVSWEFYDRTVTNACLEMRVNHENGHVYIIGGDKWNDSDDVYCNILRAKITINNSENSTAPQVIYSYYPIEITRISNITDIETKIEAGVGLVGIGYDGVVPALMDGFYEVLYSSDGKDPLYDSTTPFVCVDDLDDKEYNNYKYAWYASENFESEVIDTDDYERDNSARITPVTSWNNGNVKNYVKVKLAWDEASREDFEQAVAERTDADLIEKAWIRFYQVPDETDNKNYRYNLLNVLSDYKKDELAEFLTTAKKVLEQRANCIVFTQMMLDRLQFWYEYTYDEVNRTNFYKKCSKQFENARQAMMDIGSTVGEGSYGLSGLDDLSSSSQLIAMIREIDRQIKDILSNNLIDIEDSGYDPAVLNNTLEALIIEYQKGYNDLSTVAGGAYVHAEEAEAFYHFRHDYEQIIADIQVLCAHIVVKRQDNSEIDYNKMYEKKWVEKYDTLLACFDTIPDGNIYYNELDTNVYQPLVEILDFYCKYEGEYRLISDAEAAYCEEQLALHESAQSETAAALEAILMEGNTTEASIVHIRPIIFRMNAYGLSNVNGWDGNKIYIDDNDTYILAPQMGAGTKDEENKFTGFLMGTLGVSNPLLDDKIGLYGFYKGQTSFELSAEDGSASFGLEGKGRIHIDPRNEQALIYGGLYEEKDPSDPEHHPGQGMLINLTEPSIKFGNRNFYVDKDGFLHAVNADIEGNINATTGSIGGWKITKNTLENQATSDSKTKLVLSSATEATFGEKATGNYICEDLTLPEEDRDYIEIEKFYAKNADIESIHGKIKTYDMQIYLADEFELEEIYYFNSWFFDSPYTVKKYSWDNSENRFFEDSEGLYMGIINPDMVDQEGNPLFYFNILKWDTEDEILIDDTDGDYLRVYRQPSIGQDYGLGLYPGEDTFPGDDTFPATGEYTGPNPPLGTLFKIAQKIYTDITVEIDFDTSQDVYCRLHDSNYSPFYLIEKGYSEAGTWYKDYANGDSIKIIKNQGTYYSKIYSLVNNEYIENSRGDYIRIGTDYYRMSNYVQFKEIFSTATGYKPGSGYVKFGKTTKKNRTQHFVPEIYVFEQGMVVNDVWYTKWSPSGTYPITVYGTFKIWNVDEGAESGGEPYTQFDYIYRKLYDAVLNTGIYSGNHNSYFSTEDGFYLGSAGLSLGSFARFSADKNRIDFFLSTSTSGRYKEAEIYLGSNGISAGRDTFSVNPEGKLVAKNADITGKITSSEGNIGGFTILSSGLQGSRLKLDPYGSITMGSGGSIERDYGSGKESVVWYNQMVSYIEQYGAKVKVQVVDYIPSYIDQDTIYLLRGTYVPYYMYATNSY